VDFITPVVDDPVTFGRVAAANALSDVWAMGGEPLFVLNVAAFPRDALPLAVLTETLSAAAAVVHESGAVVAGGHTVDDPEFKFGLSVVGRVHPDRVVRNSGGRDGDLLYLTKPLGSGIATTAIKRGVIRPQLEAAVIAVMTQTNRAASRAMLAARVHAATDITGFGLLGHLFEMASGSGLGARVDSAAVPVLDGVRELAAGDVVPGGTRRNLEALGEKIVFSRGFPEPWQLVLADAQTSGGLLLAVPPERAAALEEGLHSEGLPVTCIGQLESTEPGRIRVI
jgi:selenide,water dikinase